VQRKRPAREHGASDNGDEPRTFLLSVSVGTCSMQQQAATARPVKRPEPTRTDTTFLASFAWLSSFDARLKKSNPHDRNLFFCATTICGLILPATVSVRTVSTQSCCFIISIANTEALAIFSDLVVMSDDTSTKPVTKDGESEEVTVPTSEPASSAAVEVEESVLPVEEAAVEPSQTEQTPAVETSEPVQTVEPIANAAIKAEPLDTPEAEVDDEASADATSAPTPVAAAAEDEAPLVAVKEEEVATAVDEEEPAAVAKADDPIATVKVEEPTFGAEAEEPIATATKAAEVAEPTVKEEEAAVAVKEEDAAVPAKAEEAAVTAEESRPDAKQPTSPVKGSPKKHTTSSPVPVSTGAKPGAETAKAAATAAGDTKLYLESSVIPVLRLGLRELVRVRWVAVHLLSSSCNVVSPMLTMLLLSGVSSALQALVHHKGTLACAAAAAAAHISSG
jgi:hypothetical protein